MCDLPSLGDVRRGLYTAGTRIRWESIAEWIRGESTIHGRLCWGGGAEATRRNERAYVAHGFALALMPELIARASREEVLELQRKLDEWRCKERGTLRYRAALAPAFDILVPLLEERDALLRRLDDEPAGPRHHRTAMVVAVTEPLAYRTDRPVAEHVRREHERVVERGIAVTRVFSASDQHAARHAFREEGLVPRPGVVVLAGRRDHSPCFIGACSEDGSILPLRYNAFVPGVPWDQAWRHQVEAAVYALRRFVQHRRYLEEYQRPTRAGGA